MRINCDTKFETIQVSFYKIVLFEFFLEFFKNFDVIEKFQIDFNIFLGLSVEEKAVLHMNLSYNLRNGIQSMEYSRNRIKTTLIFSGSFFKNCVRCTTIYFLSIIQCYQHLISHQVVIPWKNQNWTRNPKNVFRMLFCHL